MSDLRTLLRSVDEIRAPDLWDEIQQRGLARAPARPPAQRRLAPRLVSVAAAVIAIVAVLLTVLPPPPSALAVVRKALEDFGEIPPFRATIVGPHAGPLGRMPSGTAATLELLYRDEDGWRLEVSAAPTPGSTGNLVLWDGDVFVNYDAGTNTYSFGNLVPGYSPLGFLSWSRAGIGFWEQRCGGEASEVLADEEVSNRAARHVRCGQLELWIDAETGLMLRIKSNQPRPDQPEPFPGPIGLLPGTTVEITDVEYDPEFREGDFRFDPPTGARRVDVFPQDREEHPSSTRLRPGEVAPQWRAPLLSGGELGTDELRGEPSAVYFWATWCDVCGGERLDVLASAFRKHGGRINIVSVAVGDERPTLEDALRRGHYSFPVVLSDGTGLGSVAERWGVRSIPTLVLLDPEGRVVGVATDRGISADKLDSFLEAFVQGRSLPPS